MRPKVCRPRTKSIESLTAYFPIGRIHPAKLSPSIYPQNAIAYAAESISFGMIVAITFDCEVRVHSPATPYRNLPIRKRIVFLNSAPSTQNTVPNITVSCKHGKSGHTPSASIAIDILNTVKIEGIETSVYDSDAVLLLNIALISLDSIFADA